MDGVLVIDKPVGPTSHDIVARARRALAETRVGHTGTLDPAASGVLPLVIGKATRLARFLSAGDKSYDAVIRLGFSTDTADAQGVPVGGEYTGALPSAAAIDLALDAFRGRFLQQPPAYSAKKIDGRRSYQLARAAGSPSLPAPVEVTAHALELVAVEADRVTLSVNCSAGFYVRSLAHDLGVRLGIGAHLAALRRTRSGDYRLADAISMDAVERDPAAASAAFVPTGDMLRYLSSVVLTPDGILHTRQGRMLGPADLASAPARPAAGGQSAAESAEEVSRADELHATAGEWIRLLGPAGELLGLARPKGEPLLLHPSVVLI
jgi:tRNA pseudouridine55 synthase